MAESFVNALSKSAGIVTTSSNTSVGPNATVIAGVSTVNLGVGYLVDNQHFRGGTKIVSIDSTSQVTVDKASTNTSPVNNQPVSFLGPTATYTSPALTKSILIGGTFSNLTGNNVKHLPLLQMISLFLVEVLLLLVMLVRQYWLEGM